MKLNAALMVATLMVSGTVLAQSSGPQAGEAANVTTTGQAQNANKKTGDSGPPVDHAARASKPEAGTVGVANGQKPKPRREHFP
jgi:hypothetical protein